MNKKEIRNQPVVVFLGHVDHGKTTLLDAIRKTNIAAKEVGGITQRIGACVVATNSGRKITFIDTPGHAAFAKMRSRGAKTADIAVLVVAGNEGVKPQTKEALEYILQAGIPFIVAVTKMDLPSSSVSNVRADLESLGVVFEDAGGSVPIIPLSAKSGEGIDKLLDLILLISDLNEIGGSEEDPLEAKVIETSKGKMGISVSVVVKSGTLSVGDVLIAETGEGKVRGLFDHNGKSIKTALPGEPAKIIGFDALPDVGSAIWKKSEKDNFLRTPRNRPKPELTGEAKLKLIVRAESAGVLEAITSGISEQVEIVESGVGDVIDSDIFLAKSTGARIFMFGSKIPATTAKLADMEGVNYESFDIIYRFFERVEELVSVGDRVEVGSALIVATFPFDDKKIAGCRVVKGEIKKEDELELTRGERILGTVKIASLRKGKTDVNIVRQGEECGILMYPQLDFKEGDMLLSFAIKK